MSPSGLSMKLKAKISRKLERGRAGAEVRDWVRVRVRARLGLGLGLAQGVQVHLPQLQGLGVQITLTQGWVSGPG